MIIAAGIYLIKAIFHVVRFGGKLTRHFNVDKKLQQEAQYQMEGLTSFLELSFSENLRSTSSNSSIKRNNENHYMI